MFNLFLVYLCLVDSPVEFKVVTSHQLHADPIALLIEEIECVSILVVQNVHKGQLASVSHTAVAAVVLFQVVTKGREINSSVQRKYLRSCYGITLIVY